MKIQDLFEMPDFIDKDIEPFPFQHKFYSVDTVSRLFDILKKFRIGQNECWVVLKKDKALAVIGILSSRPDDNKLSLMVIGEVEFKDALDLSWIHEIEAASNNALQVDGASVLTSHQATGIGTNLYFALAKFGYVVISDTTQYRGGRKLWEKLIASSAKNRCAVFIVDNGEVIMNGEVPLNYNGSNYSAENIWQPKQSSPDGSKRHVLLVLKRVQ